MGKRVAFLLFVLLHHKKGTKGRPGVEGPGGQVRRDKRFTRGRVGARDHGRKGHLGSKGDTRREGKDG